MIWVRCKQISEKTDGDYYLVIEFFRDDEQVPFLEEDFTFSRAAIKKQITRYDTNNQGEVFIPGQGWVSPILYDAEGEPYPHPDLANARTETVNLSAQDIIDQITFPMAQVAEQLRLDGGGVRAGVRKVATSPTTETQLSDITIRGVANNLVGVKYQLDPAATIAARLKTSYES